ncbi:hypothetical protein D5018_09230 [Parashewanella curva]|uniref:Death domain-containing protein n=1 Tax=Parashewanella curva TaxID=2338552 RepID=A0A3L8PX54_9GAMM|nr:hypothetical protein [Parashewanella curva]RLV59976.1 hypothetical protein D5018_09230 [Parashewanella curva]
MAFPLTSSPVSSLYSSIPSDDEMIQSDDDMIQSDDDMSLDDHLESPSGLNEKTISRYLRQEPARWQEIAIQLEVPFSNCEAWETQFRNDCSRCISALTHYICKLPDMTVDKFIEAIKDAGNTALSDKVRDDYISEPSAFRKKASAPLLPPTFEYPAHSSSTRVRAQQTVNWEDHKSLQSQFRQLQKQLATQSKENRALQARQTSTIKSFQEENRTLKATVGSKVSEIKKLKQQLFELTTKTEELQRQNEAFKQRFLSQHSQTVTHSSADLNIKHVPAELMPNIEVIPDTLPGNYAKNMMHLGSKLEIISSWECIGIELGLNQDQLESIKDENRQTSHRLNRVFDIAKRAALLDPNDSSNTVRDLELYMSP